MPERSYFDWNATAPLRPEARGAIGAALLVFGFLAPTVLTFIG